MDKISNLKTEMLCNVKYLGIVGSILQQTLDKNKICRDYSRTEYGDKEYNLEAEMPCPKGNLRRKWDAL